MGDGDGDGDGASAASAAGLGVSDTGAGGLGANIGIGGGGENAPSAPGDSTSDSDSDTGTSIGTAALAAQADAQAAMAAIAAQYGYASPGPSFADVAAAQQGFFGQQGLGFGPSANIPGVAVAGPAAGTATGLSIGQAALAAQAEAQEAISPMADEADMAAANAKAIALGLMNPDGTPGPNAETFSEPANTAIPGKGQAIAVNGHLGFSPSTIAENAPNSLAAQANLATALSQQQATAVTNAISAPMGYGYGLNLAGITGPAAPPAEAPSMGYGYGLNLAGITGPAPPAEAPSMGYGYGLNLAGITGPAPAPPAEAPSMGYGYGLNLAGINAVAPSAENEGIAVTPSTNLPATVTAPISSPQNLSFPAPVTAPISTQQDIPYAQPPISTPQTFAPPQQQSQMQNFPFTENPKAVAVVPITPTETKTPEDIAKEQKETAPVTMLPPTGVIGPAVNTYGLPPMGVVGPPTSFFGPPTAYAPPPQALPPATAEDEEQAAKDKEAKEVPVPKGWNPVTPEQHEKSQQQAEEQLSQPAKGPFDTPTIPGLGFTPGSNLAGFGSFGQGINDLFDTGRRIYPQTTGGIQQPVQQPVMNLKGVNPLSIDRSLYPLWWQQNVAA